MKNKNIIFIILITFFYSCNEKNEVEKLSVDFIEQQNLYVSLKVFSQWLERGKREKEAFFYNNVRIIRNRRDVLSSFLNEKKFDRSFDQNLNLYRKTLDSISKASNFDNSKFLEILTENASDYKSKPIKHVMALSLYEFDLISYNASFSEIIGTLFTSSFQFEKPQYHFGEEIVLTNTSFDLNHYENFTYDSVSFYIGEEKQNIDYSLEQIVNTAIIKFKPVNVGNHYIYLYTSLDSHFKKPVIEKLSTHIEVK